MDYDVNYDDFAEDYDAYLNEFNSYDDALIDEAYEKYLDEYYNSFDNYELISEDGNRLEYQVPNTDIKKIVIVDDNGKIISTTYFKQI